MIERAGSRGEIAQPLLLSETEDMQCIVADIKSASYFVFNSISSSIFNLLEWNCAKVTERARVLMCVTEIYALIEYFIPK